MQPEFWSRLVHTFGPIVYRWCRSSGVSESDSPDVVQEVFASVARGISDFQRQKESGSFRSWLATITRNRVRDYFRRQARQQSAAGGTEAFQFLQQQADVIDESICGDSIDSPLVRRVLKSVRVEFEETTWRAFWLTTIESQSPSLVADSTGLSVASVYQAKSRILRRLRQAMAELPT
ncbi:ECF RNA polymerase sigma factor SigE [Planctomycetes bacterium K23_9]|uniref:ECF RNA polymerase sigma factor SigE n=2 Tax=Stieleria marina TaxID=1930275 RepID=A0A517P1R1_9BACT|nr:ECF RNA polymerase sigma factor SigE [Planctomycetes bacterium K23_9]